MKIRMEESQYLYTLSMSRKIREICDRKYVPSELATLILVCKKPKLPLKMKLFPPSQIT